MSKSTRQIIEAVEAVIDDIGYKGNAKLLPFYETARDFVISSTFPPSLILVRQERVLLAGETVIEIGEDYMAPNIVTITKGDWSEVKYTKSVFDMQSMPSESFLIVGNNAIIKESLNSDRTFFFSYLSRPAPAEVSNTQNAHWYLPQPFGDMAIEAFMKAIIYQEIEEDFINDGVSASTHYMGVATSYISMIKEITLPNGMQGTPEQVGKGIFE